MLFIWGRRHQSLFDIEEAPRWLKAKHARINSSEQSFVRSVRGIARNVVIPHTHSLCNLLYDASSYMRKQPAYRRLVGFWRTSAPSPAALDVLNVMLISPASPYSVGMLRVSNSPPSTRPPVNSLHTPSLLAFLFVILAAPSQLGPFPFRLSVRLLFKQTGANANIR